MSVTYTIAAERELNRTALRGRFGKNGRWPKRITRKYAFQFVHHARIRFGLPVPDGFRGVYSIDIAAAVDHTFFASQGGSL